LMWNHATESQIHMLHHRHFDNPHVKTFKYTAKAVGVFQYVACQSHAKNVHNIKFGKQLNT
jgi:hypothetical protein